MFHVEQDRCFDHLMSALEMQQKQQMQQNLEVDPEVDAFVSGIAFSLQKSSGQQREHLFAEIRSLIYDTLYPKRITAPRPRERAVGAEPHLGSFCPPRPVATPNAPNLHGDGTGFSSWGMPQSTPLPPTFQMDGSGEMSHTIPFSEM